MPRRRLIGTITSVKMAETALVTIETMRRHPLYGKRYRLNTSFVAHNPANTYVLGDQVEIEEHRPFSKTKHWLIRRRLVAATAPATEIASEEDILAAVNDTADQKEVKPNETPEEVKETEAL
ncbi:MAG: 30S ribosomal protein S17 [Patescibacteria group bacterium]